MSSIKPAAGPGCNTCGEAPEDACPAKMQYGAVTDYRPRCAVNAELIAAAGKDARVTVSSYDSRMFLQHNAEKFMEQERQKAIARLSPCAPCQRPLTDAGTMLPERYVVRCDAVSCVRTEANPMGLGDGRMM